MSRRVPPPELFIDRSLGRKHLPEALRACGLVVHTLSSVYGEEEGQQIPDVRWLADAGRHEWIVLMKDDAIRRRPAERDALTEARVRAFCLTNAQLRAVEQTARFRREPPSDSSSSAQAGAVHLWRLRARDQADLAGVASAEIACEPPSSVTTGAHVGWSAGRTTRGANLGLALCASRQSSTPRSVRLREPAVRTFDDMA